MMRKNNECSGKSGEKRRKTVLKKLIPRKKMIERKAVLDQFTSEKKRIENEYFN
jgi:hypothetical protein